MRRTIEASSLMALAALVASLAGVVLPARAPGLGAPTWAASTTTTAAVGATYTYRFTTTTAATLSAVTMTVPRGTGGTPALGAVTPARLAGGAVALSATTLTYVFAPTSVPAGTNVSIQIGGLANAAGAGARAATITTSHGARTVDSGTTPPLALTAPAPARSLRAAFLPAAGGSTPSWSSSSTTTGATGASYTYAFTVPTQLVAPTSVTMTVPPGTGGSPTVGTVTPAGFAGGTIRLAGTTLTYSFTATIVLFSTAVSIQVHGLTNTATAGTYTSLITATGLPGYSGTTNGVTFSGPLTLTSPGSLSWTVTLNASHQSVVDNVLADQQLTVSDATGSAAGWHITISATTLTNGVQTLPSTGTFVVTGSLASITAVGAPTATCVTTCVLPTDTTTYPVPVTTAGSAPPPATIYDSAAGTGTGAIAIGGHSAAKPIGWWVNVPATAHAGSYTSTVTLAVVSGP